MILGTYCSLLNTFGGVATSPKGAGDPRESEWRRFSWWSTSIFACVEPWDPGPGRTVVHHLNNVDPNKLVDKHGVLWLTKIILKASIIIRSMEDNNCPYSLSPHMNWRYLYIVPPTNTKNNKNTCLIPVWGGYCDPTRTVKCSQEFFEEIQNQENSEMPWLLLVTCHPSPWPVLSVSATIGWQSDVCKNNKKRQEL